MPPSCCFLALFAAAGPASAEEAIRLYRSDVAVAADGSLAVTETIRVNAEGRNIRHGIYRDFPIRFEDRSGAIARNSFELVSASRDGQPEKARVERNADMVRVWLGSRDTVVAPGTHTYRLEYRTDRQIRFFDDHDELVWNATGTEWMFPIDEAVATVRLPPGARAQKTAAYTGHYGSRAGDATASLSDDGNAVTFRTTKPLGAREGLTVAVSFPKGFVRPPTESQRLAWYLRDHLGTIIAAGGLVLVFGYYLFAWLRVGRDPPKGIAVPRWEPPEGVSPALTNYIWNRGLKRQGFPALSAAAIALSVKGYLRLDVGETVTLSRTDEPKKGVRFPVGEAALLGKLDYYGGRLTLDRSEGEKVAAVGSSFRSAMEKEHRAVFYRHNYGWIAAGVVLSVATLLATVFLGNLSADSMQILFPALVGGFILTVFSITLARSARSGLGGKIRLAFVAFFVAIALTNVGIFSASGLLSAVHDPLLVGSMVTLVLVNLLFFFLMGAPTPLGRKRTDEIEGLQRYLTVAEKDRMNMAGAPHMSPEHFETLLPYAVALGVEKPWSRAFEAWLASAAAAGALAAGYAYQPAWYHGGPFDAASIGERMGGLAGTMSDSFTAALPAPKSSSSGFSSGGGFSGGGGGGGGGGGW